MPKNVMIRYNNYNSFLSGSAKLKPAIRCFICKTVEGWDIINGTNGFVPCREVFLISK